MHHAQNESAERQSDSYKSPKALDQAIQLGKRATFNEIEGD